MRFSLIHPSRGRPARAESALREWLDAHSGRSEYEYLLSIDDDDADREAYVAMAARHRIRLVVNRNRSVVDAVNNAARLSCGDVLVVMADDFGCPPHWDAALEAALGGRRDVAVLVHDGIDGRIMTLPIIDRAFYESRRHLYFPDYVSMYVDDDLTEHARSTGRLIDARHLTFPHRHHTTGLREIDDTDRRQIASEAWREGRRVYRRRRATRFGTAPRSLGLGARLLLIDLEFAARRVANRLRRRS